ncbi:hypothetical protein CIL06_19210 [Pantoea vagans]|nr:hypothetical protein CIL06_19210 [Pantoea vagans]
MVVIISALRVKVLRMCEYLQSLVLNKEIKASRRVLSHKEWQLQVNERLKQDFIINKSETAFLLLSSFAYSSAILTTASY